MRPQRSGVEQDDDAGPWARLEEARTGVHSRAGPPESTKRGGGLANINRDLHHYLSLSLYLRIKEAYIYIYIYKSIKNACSCPLWGITISTATAIDMLL